MEEDDKLEVADPALEEREDENLEDLFNEDAEGEPNVAPAEEEKPIEALSLDELNVLAGRSGNQAFTSKDDFFKHYKSLSNLVGDPSARAREPRVEKPKKSVQTDEVSELKKEVQRIQATLVQKDFLSEVPDATPHLKLIEAVAAKDGISLKEAWEQSVKPLAQAASSYQKEREVGVNSRNRINPMTSQKIDALKNKVLQTGSRTDKERLVGEALGI